MKTLLVNEAKIYVSNSGKYWADDFLELRELSTDAQNTKRAFNAIDTILTKEVKKNAPSDYTVIRNTFVGYMKRKHAEEDVTTGAKYIRIMTNNEDVYQQFK